MASDMRGASGKADASFKSRSVHLVAIVIAASFVSTLLTACSLVLTPPATTLPVVVALATPHAAQNQETPVSEIPLAGPITARTAELSGLAWYGDTLILLPQYPDFSGETGDGFLYAIDKQVIRDALSGVRNGPIEPQRIPLTAPDLRALPGYDGLEAIAFDGDTLYVSVEVGGPNYMGAVLLAGEIAPDLSGVSLATDRWVRIDSPTGIRNLSEEAIVATAQGVLTLYEANGREVNPTPAAHRITADLADAGLLPFPNLEYRVTDASELDEAGHFWVINYFFPGDIHLRPENDPLVDTFGRGSSHASYQHVERLVELTVGDDGITLSERAPIQLELSLEPRNWEGLVRLDDDGFLLVTDSFPQTMLAFVAGDGRPD